MLNKTIYKTISSEFYVSTFHKFFLQFSDNDSTIKHIAESKFEERYKEIEHSNIDDLYSDAKMWRYRGEKDAKVYISELIDIALANIVPSIALSNVSNNLKNILKDNQHE